MAFLFPVLSFICGLILANSKFSATLKSWLSLLLARLFIPVVIIYNMVFYKSGSIALILFAFFSCFILFFIYLKLSNDRLASLCFSYTNMAWLGFPIAIAIFGTENSMAMIPLYIGVSIFGNSWAVTSVSSAPQSRLELLKKISVHDKFHRTLILSGFCFLKIAKISLNSSFFPKPIKR